MVNHARGESAGSARSPTFEITHEQEPNETLLAGFSSFGLAGLTAVDYLVDHLDLDETGHVTVEQLPAITPFQDGVPHHHTRFYSGPDLDFTVLVGELFVPVYAADPFGRAVTDWIRERAVQEVAVLSGVPVPHGPDEHRTYYIATGEYRDRRLADADVPPMNRGFLDGVNASIIAQGLESDLDACVYITPVHAQAPDVEAAIRLVDTVRDVYDLDVDTDPLEEFAAEIQQYYTELSERLQSVSEDQRPEDRMYM